MKIYCKSQKNIFLYKISFRKCQKVSFQIGREENPFSIVPARQGSNKQNIN
jgi:hypothetical protein